MMDDVDIQNALLYKVIDLSLSLVECLLRLRNILEPKPEYWSEFIEPYLREMEEQRKDVLERYRQKYGREDGDDEVFCDVQEELDRMECDDEQWQRRQQESRHPIESHNAVHCRRQLEYDDIAKETGHATAVGLVGTLLDIT